MFCVSNTYLDWFGYSKSVNKMICFSSQFWHQVVPEWMGMSTTCPPRIPVLYIYTEFHSILEYLHIGWNVHKKIPPEMKFEGPFVYFHWTESLYQVPFSKCYYPLTPFPLGPFFYTTRLAKPSQPWANHSVCLEPTCRLLPDPSHLDQALTKVIRSELEEGTTRWRH